MIKNTHAPTATHVQHAHVQDLVLTQLSQYKGAILKIPPLNSHTIVLHLEVGSNPARALLESSELTRISCTFRALSAVS